MKKLFFLALFVVLSVGLNAQTDTTIFYHGNEIKISENEPGSMQVRVKTPTTDQAETILFEGLYTDSSRSEVTTSFAFSKFIIKKQPLLDPHCSGIYVGFANLASRSLNIGDVENAVLKYNSFEVGLNLFNVNVLLSKRYGWIFYAGLGFRAQQFNADNNTAFRLNDNNVTCQFAADTNIFYSTSKLSNWYLTIPLIFEYQKRVSKERDFYVQFGFDCGLKLSSKSKVKYTDVEGKKVKEFIGDKMNVNPITVDARVEIGIGDIGIYARYGLIQTFRKNRGAEVVPVALGVMLHF